MTTISKSKLNKVFKNLNKAVPVGIYVWSKPVGEEQTRQRLANPTVKSIIEAFNDDPNYVSLVTGETVKETLTVACEKILDKSSGEKLGSVPALFADLILSILQVPGHNSHLLNAYNTAEKSKRGPGEKTAIAVSKFQ